MPDASVAPVAYAVRAERHTFKMDALREHLILPPGLSTELTSLGGLRAWLHVCDGARAAGCAQDEAPVCLDILMDGAVMALALA